MSTPNCSPRAAIGPVLRGVIIEHQPIRTGGNQHVQVIHIEEATMAKKWGRLGAAPLNVRISPAEQEALTARARVDGCSESAIIRAALQRYLAESVWSQVSGGAPAKFAAYMAESDGSLVSMSTGARTWSDSRSGPITILPHAGRGD